MMYEDMPMEELQRQLDQEYVMAGIACQNANFKDAKKHMEAVTRIKQVINNLGN